MTCHVCNDMSAAKHQASQKGPKPHLSEMVDNGGGGGTRGGRYKEP